MPNEWGVRRAEAGLAPGHRQPLVAAGRSKTLGSLSSIIGSTTLADLIYPSR